MKLDHHCIVSLYDDVKKLLATSDSHDGIINSYMKGSIFNLVRVKCYKFYKELCKCALSRHISVSCDSIPNLILYGMTVIKFYNY